MTFATQLTPPPPSHPSRPSIHGLYILNIQSYRASPKQLKEAGKEGIESSAYFPFGLFRIFTQNVEHVDLRRVGPTKRKMLFHSVVPCIEYPDLKVPINRRESTQRHPCRFWPLKLSKVVSVKVWLGFLFGLGGPQTRKDWTCDKLIIQNQTKRNYTGLFLPLQRKCFVNERQCCQPTRTMACLKPRGLDLWLVKRKLRQGYSENDFIACVQFQSGSTSSQR